MEGFICGLSILCHWSIFLVYFWFYGSTILSWLLWLCSIFWSWEPDSSCSLFLSQDCTGCLGFTCSPEELLWSFSLQWRTLTPLICWGFYFCKRAQRYCYLYPLSWNQDPVGRLHYCVLSAPHLSLYPLPYLTDNCLKGFCAQEPQRVQLCFTYSATIGIIQFFFISL